MSNFTGEDIVVQIEDGEFDDHLDDIKETVRLRKKVLADRQARAFRVGDTVRFADGISPKYLVGLSATIVKINKKTVVVDCPVDPNYGRFSGAKNVRCPNTIVTGE